MIPPTHLLILGLLGITLVGFDFSRHAIPVDEIASGGPGKDGIPAILEPKFVTAVQATFLEDHDRVLAITRGNKAKAYPIRILNWHEVVNDTIDGQPILISYCPLCGTGMAFDPVVDGKTLTFGVSGLLYKSDVLMYDHQTESLWSQIMQEAVTGEMMGTRLTLLPLIHTTWGAWKAEHPESLVLSTDTGHRRDYGRDPYAFYAESARLMFPAGEPDRRLGPKSWVIGIELNGETKAYPFYELEKLSGAATDVVGSENITIHYDHVSRTARIRDQQGDDLPSVVAYWFAWAAFHPETKLYQAP